jgi:hypothetical protein
MTTRCKNCSHPLEDHSITGECPRIYSIDLSSFYQTFWQSSEPPKKVLTKRTEGGDAK